MKQKDIEGSHLHQGRVRAHAAATATEKISLMKMPFKAAIMSVEIMPDAAVTGQDTNTTHLNILDGGAAGAGTTEIGNLDLVNGTDLTVQGPNTIMSSAAGVAIDSGDVLILQYEKVGTGLDVPENTIVVTYEGR